MTEAFFLENRIKKFSSFIINFVLIYGLFFFEIPGQENLPLELKYFDVVLSLLFGIPLSYQFIYIFIPTGIFWTQQGFHETISFSKFNFKNNEIKGFRFIKIFFITYLIIELKDPKHFIQNQSFIQKWIAKYNLKQVKSPVKIPIHKLNVHPKDIFEFLQKRYKL